MLLSGKELVKHEDIENNLIDSVWKVDAAVFNDARHFSQKVNEIFCNWERLLKRAADQLSAWAELIRSRRPVNQPADNEGVNSDMNELAMQGIRILESMEETEDITEKLERLYHLITASKMNTEKVTVECLKHPLRTSKRSHEPRARCKVISDPSNSLPPNLICSFPDHLHVVGQRFRVEHVCSIERPFETVYEVKGTIECDCCGLQVGCEKDYQVSSKGDDALAHIEVQKGIYLEKAHRLKEALRCYENAIAIRKEDKRMWHHKGRVLFKIGESKEGNNDDSLGLEDKVSSWNADTCFNKALQCFLKSLTDTREVTLQRDESGDIGVQVNGTKVKALSPDGPAEKSGQINPGDFIVSHLTELLPGEPGSFVTLVLKERVAEENRIIRAEILKDIGVILYKHLSDPHMQAISSISPLSAVLQYRHMHQLIDGAASSQMQCVQCGEFAGTHAAKLKGNSLKFYGTLSGGVKGSYYCQEMRCTCEVCCARSKKIPKAIGGGSRAIGGLHRSPVRAVCPLPDCSPKLCACKVRSYI